MATVTFDTLKFVKTLEEAGIPESQAEAFSTAVRESHEAAELATKADLREVETNLRHEISDLRKDMDARFTGVDAKLEKLELRMTIKLGSIVVVALGAFTVIFKFL
jgi:hypothetical protein